MTDLLEEYWAVWAFLIFAVCLFCCIQVFDAWRMWHGKKKFFRQVLKEAHEGNPMQQCFLSSMYRTGDGGVQKDEHLAKEWFDKALPTLNALAEQGNTEAASWLYHIYSDGKHVPKNDELALTWLKIAATGNDAETKYQLGLRYEKGDGVPQNLEKAANLFEDASELFHYDMVVWGDTEEEIREAQDAEDAYLRVAGKFKWRE